MRDRILAEVPQRVVAGASIGPDGLGRKGETTRDRGVGARDGDIQPAGDVIGGGLPDAPNAIGYVRVSKEAEDGLSLDAQAERVRAMALARGVTLLDVVVDDGSSAKSLHRPGMARLLALVDAGQVDMVLVAKLDRLTRSIVDLAALLQRFDRRDVAFVSVAEDFNTGTAMGRMVLLMIVMLSQWEREVIGERTREVLQFKKAQGERVGTIPFGYRLAADGIHLVPDEDEQALIAQIRALKAGGQSTRQIAEALNALGRTTRKGTAWRFQYVARVLASAIKKARVGIGLQQPSLFSDPEENP